MIGQVTAYIKRFVGAHTLPVFIILVIVVALIMTSVSMTLYILSGASGLDLSRPGYDRAQKNIKEDDQANFPATGSLSMKDYEAFMQLYTKKRQTIKSLDSFDESVLSDEALGLVMMPAAEQ